MELKFKTGDNGGVGKIDNIDQLREEVDSEYKYGTTYIKGLSNLNDVYMKYTENDDDDDRKTYTYSKSVYYTWAIGENDSTCFTSANVSQFLNKPKISNTSYNNDIQSLINFNKIHNLCTYIIKDFDCGWTRKNNKIMYDVSGVKYALKKLENNTKYYTVSRNPSDKDKFGNISKEKPYTLIEHKITCKPVDYPPASVASDEKYLSKLTNLFLLLEKV